MEIIHTAPELSQNFALTLIDNFAQLVAMTFAEKIQEYVQAQGKPFKAVAYELDVNRRTLYYWMNGKHSPNRALQKVVEEKMLTNSGGQPPISPERIEGKSTANPASPTV